MDTIRGWGDRDIPVHVREGTEGNGATVVVLPGSGYTPAHPLLHYSGRLFNAADFTVFELWWGATLDGWRDVPLEQMSIRLGTDTLAAVDAATEHAPIAAFVTKSLGSIGLAAAAAERHSLREIPAVWFTPLLTAPGVLDALAGWKAQSLAVMADKDPVPSGVETQHLGDLIESILTEDTNHALERVDAVESVRVLESVIAEVRNFAEHIR